LEGLRTAAAELLGAPVASVAVVGGASEGLGQLARDGRAQVYIAAGQRVQRQSEFFHRGVPEAWAEGLDVSEVTPAPSKEEAEAAKAEAAKAEAAKAAEEAQAGAARNASEIASVRDAVSKIDDYKPVAGTTLRGVLDNLIRDTGDAS
jgi:hypothetical protein